MYEDSPPPYEQVVQPLQRINCVDFWPICRNNEEKAKRAAFDDFGSLVVRLNAWLRDHPDCEISNCESLKKKVYRTAEVYDEETLFRPRGTSGCIIFGLRVWFWVKNIGVNCKVAPQNVAFVDVVPACAGGPYKFESLTSRLKKLNDQLKHRPIGGKIVTSETVILDLSKDIYSGDLGDYTNCCCFPDTYKKHKFYFTRIFYLQGEPRHETIGFADFLPVQTGDTGPLHKKPSFEPFSNLFQNASMWIKSSQGIRVTNIQTLDTRYWKLSVKGTRLDSMNTFDHRTEERHRILFLRVSYVTTNDPVPLPPIQSQIHCHTFLPKQVEDLGFFSSNYLYEGHKEILERIKAWVHSKGARILNAETVLVPEWFVGRKNTGELLVHDGDWYLDNQNDGQSQPTRYKMLYIYRVYFEEGS